MEHQLMQHPAQFVKKQLDKPASKSCSTPDQQSDTAQQLWLDWWENNIPEVKKKYIGSGEDVCLSSL